MEIKKVFTEVEYTDCAYISNWETTDESYEYWQEHLNSFMTAVREVEETFNTETFKITKRVIRETERVLSDDWSRTINKETIY